MRAGRGTPSTPSRSPAGARSTTSLYRQEGPGGRSGVQHRRLEPDRDRHDAAGRRVAACDATVERIRELRPRPILQLGCGTGLLLFRLAPGCEAYTGTDFSPVRLNGRRHRRPCGRQRVEGVIINGAALDVEALARVDLGIKALGSNPRKSSKNGMGEKDIEVSFGGAMFAPGDHLFSDVDGILVSQGSAVRD